MRCGIIVLTLLLLLATPTLATDVNGYLPPEHWCYSKLEFLENEGVLPNIYQDWFDQKSLLTYRYVQELTTLTSQVISMGRPESFSSKKWGEVCLVSESLVDEFGHPIEYFTAYYDVSNIHWSYKALDYLSRNGFLESYPERFFDGETTLTRYEMAQATAQVLDTLDSDIDDEVSIILGETLYDEFSETLTEINRALINNSLIEQGLSPRFSD